MLDLKGGTVPAHGLELHVRDPGKPGRGIGQTGYVLYAHSDAKGLGCAGRFTPHMLWVRPFTFAKSP
jgi:hypothetical protein